MINCAPSLLKAARLIAFSCLRTGPTAVSRLEHASSWSRERGGAAGDSSLVLFHPLGEMPPGRLDKYTH